MTSTGDVDCAIQAMSSPKDVDLLTILSPEYQDLVYIFYHYEANELPLHWPYDHMIILQEGKLPPVCPLYE